MATGICAASLQMTVVCYGAFLLAGAYKKGYKRRMKASVITFPGSNCDRDMRTALEASGMEVHAVWHADSELPKSDLVVAPGGFSYGDYLRCGAVAAHSPIMREVKAHAEKGGLVLGVCNGFQVLCESGLLPGVLMRNRQLKFICKDVHLRVEETGSAFTAGYETGQVIRIPIAHHDGNYVIDEAGLAALEDNRQVAFRYVDAAGNAGDAANPNGSVANIAGIVNKQKNVLGMMPHPERAADLYTGNNDGAAMFAGLLDALSAA